MIRDDKLRTRLHETRKTWFFRLVEHYEANFDVFRPEDQLALLSYGNTSGSFHVDTASQFQPLFDTAARDHLEGWEPQFILDLDSGAAWDVHIKAHLGSHVGAWQDVLELFPR